MEYENLAMGAAEMQKKIEAALEAWASEMTAKVLRGGVPLERTHSHECDTPPYLGGVEQGPTDLILWQGQFMHKGRRFDRGGQGNVALAVFHGPEMCLVRLHSADRSLPGVLVTITVGKVNEKAQAALLDYFRGVTASARTEDGNFDVSDLIMDPSAEVDLAVGNSSPLGLLSVPVMLTAIQRAAAAIPQEFAPYRGEVLGWFEARTA